MSSPEKEATKVKSGKWAFRTGDKILREPTVVGETVYVGSYDTNLYAVNAATGDEEWNFKTGAEVASSPTVVDGTVYVGSADANLYAVDADTGTEEWAFELGRYRGEIRSSPTVVDGMVYVGSRNKNLYAVDADTGTKEWVFDTNDCVKSTPIVADETVYIGSTDASLYAVNAATGTEEWTFETGFRILSSPVIVDETAYVGSDDGNLYAVNTFTGTEEWSFEAGDGIAASPTVVDNTVYVGSKDRILYAVDADTGDKKWIFEADDEIYSSPTVVNGTVYVGSNDSNLYAINADTGTQEWVFETGAAIVSSPTVVDGWVYVGSNDGSLYAVPTSPRQESRGESQNTRSKSRSASPTQEPQRDHHAIEAGSAQIPDRKEVRSPERRSLTQTDLNSLEDIGEGSQAVIKKAHLPESKTPPEVVAIREPKVSERSIPREDAEKFLNRADSWREIDDCERSKPHRWGEYEHIVGVIDIGDNLPWLALEYMDGGDLRQLLNKHPDGLPIGQALWIGECVCKGLEIPHNVGQSHLDVKPENVLLKRTDGWPWPKLADWGFARMVAEDSSSMEGYTPEYAAPEQFDTGEFGDLDQLTDIYQTGALVYTLLTGEPPVTGGHTEILNQVTEGTIPAPSERRAELPPVIDAAVGVALERQKTERYNSITNFREALNAIRTNEKLPRVVASRLQK